MSKTYRFFCTKHGELEIMIERPPMLNHKTYCPWCLRPLSIAIDAEEKKRILGPAWVPA